MLLPLFIIGSPVSETEKDALSVEVLNLADRDGNGSIDFSEFLVWFKDMTVEVARLRAKTMIPAVDHENLPTPFIGGVPGTFQSAVKEKDMKSVRLMATAHASALAAGTDVVAAASHIADITVPQGSENSSEKSATTVTKPYVESSKEVDAAVKIQAEYRGFKCRRALQETKAQKEVEKAIAIIDLEDPRNINAATIIQAGYRGKQARDMYRAKTVDDTTETAGIAAFHLVDSTSENALNDIPIGFRGKEAEMKSTKIDSGSAQ